MNRYFTMAQLICIVMIALTACGGEQATAPDAQLAANTTATPLPFPTASVTPTAKAADPVPSEASLKEAITQSLDSKVFRLQLQVFATGLDPAMIGDM